MHSRRTRSAYRSMALLTSCSLRMAQKSAPAAVAALALTIAAAPVIADAIVVGVYKVAVSVAPVVADTVVVSVYKVTISVAAVVADTRRRR